MGDLPRYPPTATIRIKVGILITSAALCGEGLMEEREAMASSQCCLKGGNIQEMKILSLDLTWRAAWSARALEREEPAGKPLQHRQAR